MESKWIVRFIVIAETSLDALKLVHEGRALEIYVNPHPQPPQLPRSMPKSLQCRIPRSAKLAVVNEQALTHFRYRDWGVRYKESGVFLTKAKDPPTTRGQYASEAGYYFFAKQDRGQEIVIDYEIIDIIEETNGK